MSEPTQLTGLQIEVAHIFFDLGASTGYLVAGGAALLAADLIGTSDRGPGPLRLHAGYLGDRGEG